MTLIFHASDLHFGATGHDALEWFEAACRTERPDLLVLTGDLVQSARKREFAAARDWLLALGTPAFIVPGNHDIPALDLIERFARPYRRFLSFAKALPLPPTLPHVTIVPLKTTARAQLRLNWAEGRVNARSLASALARVRVRPPGSIAIVACHHPLVDLPHMAVAGRTRGGQEALAKLAAAGADIILSGHVHAPHDLTLRMGERDIRLVGSGTLSARLRGFPPSFNSLRIIGKRLEVVHRTPAPACPHPV